MWRGNLIGTFRYLPTRFLNLTFKDKFKNFYPNRKKEPVKFFLFNTVLGGFTGAISLLFVYPIDFARTRLAADVGSGNNRQFKGFIDCFRKINSSDGI